VKPIFNAKIIWLEEPIDPDTGKPKLDDETLMFFILRHTGE